MTLNKTCDGCGKEITNKSDDDMGFSEWCLFHWKKRRDFCSDSCLFQFMLRRMLDKETKKDGEN